MLEMTVRSVGTGGGVLGVKRGRGHGHHDGRLVGLWSGPEQK